MNNEQKKANSRQTLPRTIQCVLDGRLDRAEAAKSLDVTVRTLQNYVKTFLNDGPEGLIDRRGGHFRKLDGRQELQIVGCKRYRPYRSARWIRDWLKLPVSVETVRLVLIKHGLNEHVPGCSTKPDSGNVSFGKTRKLNFGKKYNGL